VADWERIDWPTLQRALAAAIVRVEGELGTLTQASLAAVRRAVEAGGGTWTPELAEAVQTYTQAIDRALRGGIAAAIGPVAAATVPASLRDAWIAQQAAEAFTRRWPDGLTLSERVWKWNAATRAGVQARLAEGIALGRATGGIAMDLQRAIEAGAGRRFALATVSAEDWADRLRAAAKSSIRTKGAADAWARAVNEARAHIDTLAVGGTRRQAQAAFAAIREAVRAGRAELVDKAMDWWLYDRQLYALRRVARTEMATAYHRATLAAAQDDPDVTGYLWRLSASHPIEDICDWFAGVDFGLGEGVWPKDQVPQEKAHPHCACSLTPTTRKMRADGKRGERDLGEFMDRLSEKQRERIAPKWAQALRAEGVAWSAMMRPDGRWLDSEAAVRGRLGLPVKGAGSPGGGP
jgi:hypothetical protein